PLAPSFRTRLTGITATRSVTYPVDASCQLAVTGRDPSFLYDHNWNLRHREGRTRFPSHVRQAGDADDLRQGSAGGVHIREQFDCGTTRAHESPYSLRKSFHREREG